MDKNDNLTNGVIVPLLQAIISRLFVGLSAGGLESASYYSLGAWALGRLPIPGPGHQLGKNGQLAKDNS